MGKPQDLYEIISIPFSAVNIPVKDILNIKSSSGLAVTFTSGDTDVLDIRDATLITNKVGTSRITATQEGNVEYCPAPSLSYILLKITKGTPVIEVISNAVYLVGDKVSIRVFNNSGLPITSVDTESTAISVAKDPTVVTSSPYESYISLEIKSYSERGVSFTISYEGNENWESASYTVTFKILKIDTITWNPRLTTLLADRTYSNLLNASTSSKRTPSYFFSPEPIDDPKASIVDGKVITPATLTSSNNPINIRAIVLADNTWSFVGVDNQFTIVATKSAVAFPTEAIKVTGLSRKPQNINVLMSNPGNVPLTTDNFSITATNKYKPKIKSYDPIKKRLTITCPKRATGTNVPSVTVTCTYNETNSAMGGIVQKKFSAKA